MSDADLRALERLAEKQNDAASWEKVAYATTREEKWDQAGRAIGLCRALGGEPVELEKTLEPASLDAFELREVAKTSLGSLVFVPGENSVIGAGPQGAASTVVKLSLTTGKSLGQLLTSKRQIQSLTVDPRGERWAFLTVDQSYEGRSHDPYDFGVASLETGKVTDKLALKWNSWRRVVWSGGVGNAVIVYGSMVRMHLVSAKGKLEREPWWSLISRDTRIGQVGGRAVADKAADAISVHAPDDQDYEGVRLARKNTRGVIWAKYADDWFSIRSLRRFLEREDLLKKHARHGDSADALAVSPSGRYVALSPVGYPEVTLLDFETGKTRLFELRECASQLVWSPCGRQLLFATYKTVGVLEVQGASRA